MLRQGAGGIENAALLDLRGAEGSGSDGETFESLGRLAPGG